MRFQLADSGRTLMIVILGAIGWYRDPYGVHEDRYFSQGFPTKLVRDGCVESYDPPPGRFLPELLIPVPLAGPAVFNGTDLRRADDATRKPPGRRTAMRPALSVFEQIPLA
jgi:hypothetical protein